MVAAAKLLGVSPDKLFDRMRHDPQLRAFCVRDMGAIGVVTEMDASGRTAKDNPLPKLDKEEAGQILQLITKQDREIMNKGLVAAGLKQSTVDQLRALEGLADDSGKFLCHTLDISYRMMIFQNLTLFEQGNWIQKEKLSDPTLSDQERTVWIKIYQEITGMIQKGYGLALSGTQAMVQMMIATRDGNGDGKKKRKPGFAPKTAEKAAPQEGSSNGA